MTRPELRQRLIEKIGLLIDEESFDDMPSFIEMNHDVIHVVAEVEAYFRVTLNEVEESAYFADGG